MRKTSMRSTLEDNRKETKKMPHKVEGGWKWGNIERDTKGELVKVVYGIWQKNGSKGKFEDFWETGKTTGDAKDSADELRAYLEKE